MARSTPEERKRQAEEVEQERKRLDEEAEQERVQREARREWLNQAMNRRDYLESVVDGLYDQATKAANKNPVLNASELLVSRTNKAIQAVKALMSDQNDDFLEDINVFVPAGDRVVNRDVALVLRELTDALDRFNATLKREMPPSRRQSASDLLASLMDSDT